MEDDVLQQIVYSIQSGMSEIREETRQFRAEAARQNMTMSKFMSDISNSFFTKQNEYQSDLNSSMNEIERQTASTNQNINELEYILRESMTIQSRMVSELREVSRGIGSLIQLFQQNSGSNQFSFGGVGGAAAGLLGGAALTGAVGLGLSGLLSSAGTAQASDMISGGQVGNSDTGGGERLSVSEMVKLAKEAGFNDQEAAIMGAIGAAESSGNTKAYNPQGRDNSYGLWQINMLGQMGEERRRQFGIENNEQLWNPQINAKAAREIFEQQGFDAWTVYQTGAYKKFLGTAQESVGNVEASKEDASDGKVVDKPSVTNSMGGLNSEGSLTDRKGFVIHHTGGRGDVDGVIDTLNQRGLSVQYVIDREGAIHQLMPSGSKAQHMKKGQGVGKGLSNSNTEGVEIIANDDSDILPIQVEAAKKLASQLGYAPNQVYGHGEINPHKQKTEGATVVSAIRGGTSPADPSKSESATGSTGLEGESGNSAEMQPANPFAGTIFEGLTSQISQELNSLMGFGQAGQSLLTGAMMPGFGSIPMLGNIISSLPGQLLQNNKLSEISAMSNNLGVEKIISELSGQGNKQQTKSEVSTQARQPQGTEGPSFTPTVGTSASWVDKLAGKTKYSKSFIMNGVYA